MLGICLWIILLLQTGNTYTKLNKIVLFFCANDIKFIDSDDDILTMISSHTHLTQHC